MKCFGFSSDRARLRLHKYLLNFIIGFGQIHIKPGNMDFPTNNLKSLESYLKPVLFINCLIKKLSLVCIQI